MRSSNDYSSMDKMRNDQEETENMNEDMNEYDHACDTI